LTTATDDDQFIGQRLRDLGPYVDYVSPMVYPDTWNEASDLIARGLGVKNCTVAVNCPYDIIFNSYKRAAEKTPTKVRLWLQAYSGRGDFGVKEYRIQKTAAWMLAVMAGYFGMGAASTIQRFLIRRDKEERRWVLHQHLYFFVSCAMIFLFADGKAYCVNSRGGTISTPRIQSREGVRSHSDSEMHAG